MRSDRPSFVHPDRSPHPDRVIAGNDLPRQPLPQASSHLSNGTASCKKPAQKQRILLLNQREARILNPSNQRANLRLRDIPTAPKQFNSINNCPCAIVDDFIDWAVFFGMWRQEVDAEVHGIVDGGRRNFNHRSIIAQF